MEVLKACSTISEYTIGAIIVLLKNTHERDIHTREDTTKTLAAERESIVQKQDRLTDLLLEGTIGKEAYEEKLKAFKDRKEEISRLLDTRPNPVENIHVTAAIALRLVKNAYELLESSEPLEKRALLNFALQNSKVNGKNLEFTMTSPFYTMYDIALCPNGLPVSVAEMRHQPPQGYSSIPSTHMLTCPGQGLSYQNRPGRLPFQVK